MGFTPEDTKAINDIIAAGIRIRGLEYPDNHHVMEIWMCPEKLAVDQPDILLAKAIEGRDRAVTALTVCLEVEAHEVPDYIVTGLECLADTGYPVKVIVICGSASTHEPGTLLSERLRKAVARCNPGGTLWHPIAKTSVHSPSYRL